MSLFPSTLTGRILDDGVTEPPVIELQAISAGQLATVLTAYTPLETSTQHTADIGTNAAAIAALQGQVSALPAAPDLTPYALAAAEGLIAANASGLTAVNTSLTLGLASKANQSALDALQVQVDGKSTPASVDLKLANHPTTAAMNSSHRLDQQRHPGHGRGDLRAEERGGPAGHRRGRSADRGGRGPAGGHGAPVLPHPDGTRPDRPCRTPASTGTTRRFSLSRTPGPSPRQETSATCRSPCNPPSTGSWRRSPPSVAPPTWSTPRPGWGT